MGKGLLGAGAELASLLGREIGEVHGGLPVVTIEAWHETKLALARRRVVLEDGVHGLFRSSTRLERTRDAPQRRRVRR